MRLFLSVLLGFAASVLPLAAQEADATEFFEKRVRPVLANKCQACHNSGLKTGGLDLSSAEGFASGGQNGPVVSTETPAESRILEVIRYQERIKMPPGGMLPEDEIAVLADWVETGAHWPGVPVMDRSPVEADGGGQFTAEERNFWAFRKVQDPEPPQVTDENWVRSPVDRFVLARLEAANLRPAAPASRLAWLRRASYDLTGLPPGEELIAAFLSDDSPRAFERVVDRLLASPRYGERWGRHWLDVARYADSTGNDEDHRYPYAWRYRDYVVQAFNDDLPYDEFITEQLAGDLLHPGAPVEKRRRGIVATGFLALGPKALAQQDKQRMLYDVWDEQLDVVSKGFLGLTVTCARCHDHKFDPIPTKDYYSLLGMFASTRSFTAMGRTVSKLLFTPLVPEREYQAYQDHKESIGNKKFEIEDVVDQELQAYVSKLSPRLADYMLVAGSAGGDEQAEALAADHDLEAPILRKWIDYLRPRQVRRPHMDEWRQASDANRPQAAAAYQKRFHERLEEWNETLRKWRERVRRMLKEMNMPPPPRPKFEPGEDRFFHEVYFADKGPFFLEKKAQEQVFSQESNRRLDLYRRELKHLEETLPPEPAMACAVEDGDPVRQRVFVRGDYNNLGEEAPKRFPQILAGTEQEPISQGSGRLELARWLTGPEHPLTARVMVNRIWKWHFGQGLVRTPNNFGKLGTPPTHPQLLDYLARRFVREGWSIKKMHRLIMNSATYGMGSGTTPDKSLRDPQNQLLSRFERRRLEVEEIRDGLLSLDGSLDLAMGGTLQTGFGTDTENSNDRLSLKPETVHRRMVYVPLRRANLPTLLNLFDFGDATTSMGKRSHTNVAPQALFMMNSEFVADRARNLATRLEKEHTDPAQRIDQAYLITLNRMPETEERQAALAYLGNFTGKFGGPEASGLNAWGSFCRILMASNDFMYVD